MPSIRNRRRAQAGTTLIELLVSLTIVGLALVLVIGTISTGLLNAALVKRNTAVQAVTQYELDKISASNFNASAQKYSECFATETPADPVPALGYEGNCPGGTWALRADLKFTQPSPTIQVWTVTVKTWPAPRPVASPVSVYKVDR
jgi:type II secretory pathway pseudopilin PulG